MPLEDFSMTAVALMPLTRSLNIAVTFADRLTLRPLAAGVITVTAGRGPVVKLHLVGARALPAPSLIRLFSVTMYVVSAASIRLGLSVATRVLAL